MLSAEQLAQLAKLRQELHHHPEISNEEVETAKRIKAFIDTNAPADETVLGLGAGGMAFIYNSADLHGKTAGKTVLIRAELDGLPVQEGNEELAYRSCNADTSHTCGHDGHMATVAAVAVMLHQQRPQNGRVVLLFQPAEETGSGMQSVIADAKFAAIKPDYAFALHNIPGMPLGQVSTKEGSFSSSVESLIFRFTGMTSHAAEPQKAANPAQVIAQTIVYLGSLNDAPDESPEFVRCSTTHVYIGEADSHGVTAGFGQLDVTIRARTPQKLEQVKHGIDDFIANQILAYNATLGDAPYKLEVAREVTEPFVANVNDADAVALIRHGAAVTNTLFVEQQVPNNWGEDNGALTNLEGVKGAMFGLGSGVDQPPLHNRNFDYPDSLIAVGAGVFWEATREIWRQVDAKSLVGS